MKDSRLFALLLRPSTLSFVLSASCAALITLGANWSYLQAQSFFTTYLSGNYGLGSLLSDLQARLVNALDSNLAYNSAVICFSILFGFSLYAIAICFRRIVLKAQATLDEVGYANRQARWAIEKSLGLHVGVRVLSSLLWLIYIVCFFNNILPYCVSRIAQNTGETIAFVTTQNLLIFGLLFLATHAHVIFARLIALRPRLFGGW